MCTRDQLVCNLGEARHCERLGAEDLVGDHVGERTVEAFLWMALQELLGGREPGLPVALELTTRAVAERRRPAGDECVAALLWC